MERFAWHRIPPVIVWERSGRWAAWWRAIVSDAAARPGWRMIETRSVSECRRELDSHPQAFVVLELTSSNAGLLGELLVDQPRQWPLAALVVVADAAARPQEAVIRSLGALGWADSPRRLRPLVEMARRHALLQASPFESIREAIEAQLPWSNSLDK